MNLLRRFIAAWQADTERLNEYNRQTCLQRDRERQQFYIWNNIVF